MRGRGIWLVLALGGCGSGVSEPVGIEDADLAPGRCGDGELARAEECDDGRVSRGDGCSAECSVEAGWVCDGVPSVCEPVCGDGVLVRVEPCDDGNRAAGDGCSADCAFEGNWSCTGEPSICVPNQICPNPVTIVDIDGGALGSCKAHREAGRTNSGLYAIDTGAGPYLVLCDMVTDGGGWTIIVNNDNSDPEPSECLPRIASTDALSCGSINCDEDFTVRADGIGFTEMLWAAYSGPFAFQSYKLLGFDSPVTIPNTELWSLNADQMNGVVDELSALPTIECRIGNPFTSASPGLRRVANERPNQATGGFGASLAVTFFDIDSDTTNPGRMSFTDASGGTGTTAGLDDFQDGHGCEDNWAPIGQRGASSLVMIR